MDMATVAGTVTADTGWYAADKTSFEIVDAADLLGLAMIVNGTAAGIAADTFEGDTVKLTADIDLQSNAWMPIGKDTWSAFNGTFDGNNKTIKGLAVTDASLEYGGLFGVTASAAVIKDLTISEPTVSAGFSGQAAAVGCMMGGTLQNVNVYGGSVYTSNAWGVGGLVGQTIGSVGARFIDCSNSAAVTASVDWPAVGGILATCDGSGAPYFSGCSNSGVITATKEEPYIGGIMGVCWNNGAVIENCSNSGAVTAKGDYSYIGGIVGYGAQISIIDCTNSGVVTVQGANATGGGILGYTANDSIVITGCINTGDIDGAVATKPYMGGIVGRLSGTAVIEKSANSGAISGGSGAGYVGGLVGYNNTQTKFDNCYNAGIVTTKGSWAGGIAAYNSTSGEYTNVLSYGPVSSTTDGRSNSLGRYTNRGTLLSFYAQEGIASANPSDAIIVTADELMSGELAWLLDGGSGVRQEMWAQGEDAPQFYDGTNKLVFRVGLPQAIEGGAVVLDRAYIRQGDAVSLTVTPDADKMLYSLVVTNDRTGLNIVSAADGLNRSFVMPGSDVSINAVFGAAPADDAVFNVSFKDADGSDIAIDGQTVGKDQQWRANQPQEPAKEGKTFVGWYLNGQPYDFNTVITEDIVLNAKWKSEGAVVVTLALNHPGAAAPVEYETDSTGKLNGAPEVPTGPVDEYNIVSYVFRGWYTAPEGGRKVDLSGTFSEDTYLFAQWDFSDIYEKGTADAPTVIDSEVELRRLAERIIESGNTYADNYLELGADIVLDSKSAWLAIGTQDVPFAGHFDGKGYTVSGMTIEGDADYQGLFGNVTGTVENVSVNGTIIGTGNYVGGVVGCSSGTLNNVSFGAPVAVLADGEDTDGEAAVSSIKVTGNYVGGVAGYAQGTLTDCCNYAAVSGGNYVGGLFGAIAVDTKIVTSESEAVVVNSGTVSGGSYVGGIVGGIYDETLFNTENGTNRVIFTRVINDGDVMADGSYVGGIIGAGVNTKMGVVDCVNNGNVSGYSYVGGFAGGTAAMYADDTTDWNINNGDVAGKQYVGGVVGYATNLAEIVKVQSGWNTITQEQPVNFQYFGNNGKVSGNTSVGGIIGHLDSFRKPVVQLCWNVGDVSGKSNSNDVGGLIGCLTRQATVRHCYVVGTVVNSGVGAPLGVVNGDGHNSTYTSLLYYNAEAPLDVCAAGAASITNCYYLAPDGAISGALATALTAEQIEKGMIPYLMNGSQALAYWTDGDGEEGSLPFVLTRDSSNNYYKVTLSPLATDSRLSVSFGDGVMISQSDGVSQSAIIGKGAVSLPLVISISDMKSDDVPSFSPDIVTVDEDGNYTLNVGSLSADITVIYSLEEDKYSEGWYSDAVSAFTLYTEDQLHKFAELVSAGNDFSGKTVFLGNDITLTKPWSVAGSVVLNEDGTVDHDNSNLFAGIFNGQGHTISGLSIGTAASKYSGDFAGMFAGVVGNVNNLNLKDVNIYSDADYVGAVAGYAGSDAAGTANSGYVQSVKVADAYISGNNYVGGIVGCSESSPQSYALRYITFGAAEDDNSKVVAAGDYVGGIVGYSFVQYRDMVNYGEVSGRDNVGGLIGYIEYSDTTRGSIGEDINDIQNFGDVKGRNNIGGIVGRVMISDEVAKKTTYFFSLAHKNTGTDYLNNGNVTAAGDNAGGYIGYFGGNVNGNFYAPNGKTALVNCGDITAGGEYAGGMYGRIGSFVPASVNNYSIVRNDGAITAKNYAGGIIGGAEGDVTLVHFGNTGLVSAVSGSAVGSMLGGIKDGAAVFTSSFSTTALAPSGAKDNTYNYFIYAGDTEAEDNGLVTVPADDFKSGKAAWMLNQYETQVKSYFTWSVDDKSCVRASGNDYQVYYRVRLIDPDIRANMADSGYLAWPAGVKVYDEADGLTHTAYLARNATMELENKLTAGNRAAFAPSNAVIWTVGTDADVYTLAAVSADTDIRYKAGKSVDADYAWYTNAAEDATEYIITTEGELIGFANLVNGSAVINDAPAQDSFFGKTVRLGADISMLSASFAPIGKSSSVCFEGTFDGGIYDADAVVGSHTVSNLYVSTNAQYNGLFGYTRNAALQNFAVSGVVSGGNYSAGIVGYAENTTFENITMGTANGESMIKSTGTNVGGIVGRAVFTTGNLGLFKNVVNYADVTAGSNYVAGLIGYDYSNTGASAIILDKCANYGDITGTGYLAGLIGATRSRLYIDESCNAGNISTTSTSNPYAAGLVAYMNSITNTNVYEYDGREHSEILYMTNSENSGDITATLYGAGAVCRAYGSAYVDGFVNTGDITLSANSGYNISGSGVFTNCYAPNEQTVFELHNIKNYGDVNVYQGSAGLSVSGIVVSNSPYEFSMGDCVNYGDINISWNGNPSSYAVSVAGVYVAGSNVNKQLVLARCGNEGNISFGATSAVNFGYSRSAAGVASIDTIGKSGAVSLLACYNTGNITSDNVNGHTVAGIAAANDSQNIGVEVCGCYNNGTLASDNVYAVSNAKVSSKVDHCYYAYLAGNKDTSAAEWIGSFAAKALAGSLNQAKGCADVWTTSGGRPAYASDGEGIRQMALTWSSVDKDGKVVDVAANKVTVSGEYEAGSDGVYYVAQSDEITLRFAGDDNYVLQLVTMTDADGNELYADCNIAEKTIKLDAPSVTVDALFHEKVSTAAEFTVSFDLNGAMGEVPAAQTVAAYTALTEVADPVWQDRAFMGWYTDKSGGEQWNFSSAVMQDMTLYARWFYGAEVIFDLNYAGGIAPDTQFVSYDDKIAQPAVPTRDSYKDSNAGTITEYSFAGWYTAADETGVKWDFDIAITSSSELLVAGDPVPTMTLYAHWTELDSGNYFTVSFEPNYPGAEGAGDVTNGYAKYAYGQTIVPLAAPERPALTVTDANGDEVVVTEYVFKGWYPVKGHYNEALTEDPFDFDNIIITSDNIEQYASNMYYEYDDYGYNIPKIYFYAMWEEKDVLFEDDEHLEIDSAVKLRALLDRVDKSGMDGSGNQYGGSAVADTLTGKTFIITESFTFDGTGWDTTPNRNAAFDGCLTAVEGVTLTLTNLKRPLFVQIGTNGVVDGLNITGNYETLPDERATGNHAFLAGNNAGTIKNCTLTDAEIRMTDDATDTAYYYLGGLAGQNDGAMIDCTAENCRMELLIGRWEEISGGMNDTKIAAGMLAGTSFGETNGLTVSGGYIDAVQIGEPKSSDLSLFGGYSGGYDNYSNPGYTELFEEGKWYSIGGVAGKVAAAENCVNNGCEVNGALFAGGLFGYSKGDIGNCSNSGSVKAYLAAGGISGHARNESSSSGANGEVVTISDCVNTGEIGNTKAGETLVQCAFGGIVGLGHTMIVIKDCVNGTSGQTIVVPGQIYNYGGILGAGTRYRDVMTRVINCTNYANFAEEAADDYFMGNIGGVVGAGAVLAESCANLGDIILPHAVNTGGLGGGECQLLYTDVQWGQSAGESGNAIGTGNGVAYIDPTSFRDCLFHGTIVTADGMEGGVLIGGPGYMLENCVWIDTSGNGSAEHRMIGTVVDGMMRYGVGSGPTSGMRRGVRNIYYAVSGAEDGESITNMVFSAWSTVGSGEMAWLIDGGEEKHRNLWTQGEEGPIPGTPTVYRLTVTVEGEAEDQIYYLKANEGYALDFSKPNDVEMSGNEIITTTYTPQYIVGTNCTESNGEITISGNNAALEVTYLKEVSTKIIDDSDDYEKVVEPEVPTTATGEGDGAGTGTGTGGTGEQEGGTSTQPADNESQSSGVVSDAPASPSRPQQPQAIELPEEQETEEQQEELPEEPQQPQEIQEEPEDEMQVESAVEEVEQENNNMMLLIAAAVVLAFFMILLGRRKKK